MVIDVEMRTLQTIWYMDHRSVIITQIYVFIQRKQICREVIGEKVGEISQYPNLTSVKQQSDDSLTVFAPSFKAMMPFFANINLTVGQTKNLLSVPG